MSHDPYAPVGKPLTTTRGRVPDVVVQDDPPTPTPAEVPLVETAAETVAPATEESAASENPEDVIAAQLAALDALRESE